MAGALRPRDVAAPCRRQTTFRSEQHSYTRCGNIFSLGNVSRRPDHSGRMSANGLGCVKTHTSAKCGKYNSPSNRRAVCVQYDLALIICNAFEIFYARSERGRFYTAKTHKRHSGSGYSITSSARASSIGETSSPSALAVLRLMISNFVGCTTEQVRRISALQNLLHIRAR